MKQALSVLAFLVFIPLSGNAQESDKVMTLEVKSIAIKLQPFDVSSIKAVAEKSEEIVFSGDKAKWFKNATVENITLPKGSEFTLGVSGGEPQFQLMDRSKVVFAFKVDKKTYPISIGNGSKLAVRKSSDGKYALLPEETAKLSPPAVP